jgi:hypothetical protein
MRLLPDKTILKRYWTAWDIHTARLDAGCMANGGSTVMVGPVGKMHFYEGGEGGREKRWK